MCQPRDKSWPQAAQAELAAATLAAQAASPAENAALEREQAARASLRAADVQVSDAELAVADAELTVFRAQVARRELNMAAQKVRYWVIIIHAQRWGGEGGDLPVGIMGFIFITVIFVHHLIFVIKSIVSLGVEIEMSQMISSFNAWMEKKEYFRSIDEKYRIMGTFQTDIFCCAGC